MSKRSLSCRWWRRRRRGPDERLRVSGGGAAGEREGPGAVRARQGQLQLVPHVHARQVQLGQGAAGTHQGAGELGYLVLMNQVYYEQT